MGLICTRFNYEICNCALEIFLLVGKKTSTYYFLFLMGQSYSILKFSEIKKPYDIPATKFNETFKRTTNRDNLLDTFCLIKIFIKRGMVMCKQKDRSYETFGLKHLNISIRETVGNQNILLIADFAIILIPQHMWRQCFLN